MYGTTTDSNTVKMMDISKRHRIVIDDHTPVSQDQGKEHTSCDEVVFDLFEWLEN